MIITTKPQEIVRVMTRLISEKILQQVSSKNIKKKRNKLLPENIGDISLGDFVSHIF